MHETNEGSSLNKSHANFGIETMPYDAVQYCTRTMQPTNAVMCKTDSTIILAGQIPKIINSENRENHQTQRPPNNRSGQIRNHRGAFKKWLIVPEIKKPYRSRFSSRIVPVVPVEWFPLFLSPAPSILGVLFRYLVDTGIMSSLSFEHAYYNTITIIFQDSKISIFQYMNIPIFQSSDILILQSSNIPMREKPS